MPRKKARAQKKPKYETQDVLDDSEPDAEDAQGLEDASGSDEADAKQPDEPLNSDERQEQATPDKRITRRAAQENPDLSPGARPPPSGNACRSAVIESTCSQFVA